ncbi:MAG: fused MFS/spermidine synthase [Bacteroidetes bacterium]|nr:fused MFS/spermidine synthase [Bacteroidota bacterium]
MKKSRLYFLSFTEGAAVMAAEICSARLIAPFYGSSLYVWSSVMAVTLGGLALGYFMGGRFSLRENRMRALRLVVLMAMLSLVMMPVESRLFFVIALHAPLIPAVIGSVVLLLFPVMFFMGATSPLIISCLTQEAGRSGENSGRVYAVSTCGGILATFACGFYTIPEFGITLTLMGFAILLALAWLLNLGHTGRVKNAGLLLLPAIISVYGFISAPKHPNTIYESDGIMGKLEIRDEPSSQANGVVIRKLLINTIVQTEMDLGTRQSVSDYAHLLAKNNLYMPKGKVLLMGLGGGVIANMLHDEGYDVTAVEFDQRIMDVARRFFYMNPEIHGVCDDARHYLNEGNGYYNLVIFDIFKAEEQPAHVLTREGLQQLKKHIDTSSVVIINTHGYLKGIKGAGTQCMLATLREAGFDVKICPTNDNEDYRNVLIYASLKTFQVSLHNESYPIEIENAALINTDGKPVLEKLNAPANQAWRSNYIRNYITRY